MPRRAAARRRSCHSGRMKLIVMPSSHHLQLILSSLIRWAAENAGVRNWSSLASCVVPGENGKRYQLHQPASNDSGLACRSYPNDPANLIPTSVHPTR